MDKAIITAIANGASRMSEISGKVGENTNMCAVYVKNLVALVTYQDIVAFHTLTSGQ